MDLLVGACGDSVWGGEEAPDSGGNTRTAVRMFTALPNHTHFKVDIRVNFIFVKHKDTYQCEEGDKAFF